MWVEVTQVCSNCEPGTTYLHIDTYRELQGWCVCVCVSMYVYRCMYVYVCVYVCV